MKDRINTPFDDPIGILERITFPGLRAAYIRGAESANELGHVAMECGLDRSSIVGAAQIYIAGRVRMRYSIEQMRRHLLEQLDQMEEWWIKND